MRLSICIPTHDGRRDVLEEALQSIAVQVRPGQSFETEIVVSDNASGDGTDHMVAAFAAHHPHVPVVYGRNDRNVGLANIARVVERATGDWCWLFGSDDVMVEGALELVAATIAAHPDTTGVAVGRVDFDHAMQTRIGAGPPDGAPAENEITVFSGLAAIAQALAFQHAFLGANIVRRDRWLAVAREHAEAAVVRHPDWPQMIVLTEMARRDPVWVWQPTVLVRARAGRPYLVEDDGALPNLARMHVLLVDGLRRAWAELTAGDRELYRTLMRRAYAVVATPDVVHHIKLSRGHDLRWGLELCRSFVAAFWWSATFRRRALPRLMTPAPLYRANRARRARAWVPMPVLEGDACRVRVEPEGSPAAWRARETRLVPCRVTNTGPTTLRSSGDRPVQVGCRWSTSDGDVVLEGPRTPLARPLAPGRTAAVAISVPVPWEAGHYRLRIGCVQEQVRWFGDVDAHNDFAVEVDARLPLPPAG